MEMQKVMWNHSLAIPSTYMHVSPGRAKAIVNVCKGAVVMEVSNQLLTFTNSGEWDDE